MLLARSPARHHNSSDGGGISAAQQCRQHDSALPFGHLLQNITSVRDGADGYHYKPRLERIDMKLAVFLIGQNGKNNSAKE